MKGEIMEQSASQAVCVTGDAAPEMHSECLLLWFIPAEALHKHLTAGAQGSCNNKMSNSQHRAKAADHRSMWLHWGMPFETGLLCRLRGSGCNLLSALVFCMT